MFYFRVFELLRCFIIGFSWFSEINRVFYFRVFMNIHSRDKSLSLNFRFIIGYPPYYIKLHENGQTIWFSESIRIKWRNNWDPYFNRHKTNKNNKPSLFGANPNKMVPKSRTLNFFIYFLTISCSKISKKWQKTTKTIIYRDDRPSSVSKLIRLHYIRCMLIMSLKIERLSTM